MRIIDAKPNLPVVFAGNAGFVPTRTFSFLSGPKRPDVELAGRPLRCTGKILELGPNSEVEVRGVLVGSGAETFWMRADDLHMVN